MRVNCQRDSLLGACQVVSLAAATRSPKPILANIKAIAQDDHLILMATDHEIGIRYKLQGVRVEEPGECVFPIARFIPILREAQDLELAIEASDAKLKVFATTSEFEMPTENPADFPDIPTFDSAKYHAIKAGVLRTMIQRTIFAAAKEATRFAIQGILWEVESKQARLVATDTRRLALTVGEAEVHGGETDPKGQSHLVPTKAMSLLERNLSDDEETIKIALHPNDVLFQTEKSVIYARLVEGRFAPYRDILSVKATTKIRLPVESFLAGLRQAAIMTEKDSKRVLFQFTRDRLTLIAQGAETGRSKVEVRLEYEGPNIDISFDPDYIIDMLKVLDASAELDLELVNPNKPALFRCGNDYLYLVMPLTETR